MTNTVGRFFFEKLIRFAARLFGRSDYIHITYVDASFDRPRNLERCQHFLNYKDLLRNFLKQKTLGLLEDISPLSSQDSKLLSKFQRNCFSLFLGVHFDCLQLIEVLEFLG